MKNTISRDELMADLKTGIGGSECHNLFDLEPYGCRRKLWYQKTGAEPDFEFHGTTDTRRGTYMEPYVCAMYARETKRRLARSRMVTHAEVPWWMCHPDRLIVGRPKGDPMARLGRGILEVKCPSVRTYLKVKREGLNDAWILQLQHSLGASEYRWGSYAIFSAELWELVHFDVVRDEEVIGTIRSAVEKFWPKVENGPPPDRLLPTDARCHKCSFRTQCQGQALIDAIAADQVNLNPGEDLPNDPGLEQMFRDLTDARAVLKEAKTIEQIAADTLGTAIGNRAAVIAGSAGKIYYRPFERKSLDEQAIRKEHPEIAAKYERTSIVRPLKLYTDKE